MSLKGWHPMSARASVPRETAEKGFDRNLERRRQQEVAVEPGIPTWLKPVGASTPRILIVHDDDTVSRELEVVLLHSGLVSERVKSMKAGCDYVRSGKFHVVVTKPVLEDGSWRGLIDIDSHYRPGFVVILVATTFDLNEWGRALEEGAFDVLDELYELPHVAEVARRALWAAYLKGAGPRPETRSCVHHPGNWSQ
jgi:DNA-binding NtrC family response regulator